MDADGSPADKLGAGQIKWGLFKQICIKLHFSF